LLFRLLFILKGGLRKEGGLWMNRYRIVVEEDHCSECLAEGKDVCGGHEKGCAIEMLERENTVLRELVS